MRDTEMRAHIGGVTAQMENFDFFSGIHLGRRVLSIIDNLSRPKNHLSMRGTRSCVHDQVNASIYEVCNLFWDYVQKRASSVDVNFRGAEKFLGD